MYNLHSHSLLSDGALLPSEVAVRFAALGYKAIAITDHVDYSNIKTTVEAILEFTKHWGQHKRNIKVLSGVELSHLPPEQFKPLAGYARDKGIQIIIAHGETLVEPVIKGSNRAALEADIDILAHPGLISRQDAEFAKKKGIFLEITARTGHSGTNRHVAEMAQKFGVKLALNIDSHTPEDIIEPQELIGVGLKAGLSQKDLDRIYKDAGAFIKKKEG